MMTFSTVFAGSRRAALRWAAGVALCASAWAQAQSPSVPAPEAAALPKAASTLATASKADHPAKAAFPLLRLPDAKSQGQRALDLLGERINEVAPRYGKSAAEFRSRMLLDQTLRLDARGRLFVEEVVRPARAVVGAATDANESLTGQLRPLNETFLLHSRPGARRTIYLNFRGATLNGTAWNNGATIVAQPFDIDGVPGQFSTTELQRVQYIWQRVAEDYAPFDVDVTTEPPPPEALTRSSSSDQVFGTTALITNNSGVYNCRCGGVAYVGVYDEVGDFYKPALVFHNQLGNDEKNIAEATSHEVGHNLGLDHDGFSGGDYYAGQGSGATGWAPIMGTGYTRPLVQWSKGEYSTANNVQDDLAVIVNNGVPLRTDDHGNTTSAATALQGTVSGSTARFDTTGVVERPTDVDYFAFTANAGSATVTLTTAVRAANLDARIELRDAAGTLLTSANPVDGLNATLTANLASSGTYYVTVLGVGKGDPLSTGYTDYGSLGQYALTVEAPAGGGGGGNNQLPVAAISATPTSGTVPLTVQFSASGSSDPDGSITAYDWTFGDGTTGTGATASHVYQTVGSFTAQLRVTDNAGGSATKSVVITVNAADGGGGGGTAMRVSDIGMSVNNLYNVVARGIAAVKVTDGAGNPVAGATVAGTWSGLVGGSGSATTNSAGVATLASGYVPQRGTFIFTVTGVSKSGSTYQSGSNTESSDSISW